jgi:hypothetical protein
MATNIQIWARRLEQMKACQTTADLIARYGEPHHKVQQDGFEIWHYPLGVASGMLYSIHVSAWPDRPPQTYLFFEPTDLEDSPVPEPSWQRWAGAFALCGAAVLGYLSVYRPIVDAIHHQHGTDFFSKLAIGVPLLLYVGLVLAIFGPKSSRILGTPGREPRAQLVVVVALCILGILLFLWVGSFVERHSAGL